MASFKTIFLRKEVLVKTSKKISAKTRSKICTVTCQEFMTSVWTYLVALNTRKSLAQRNTLTPRGGMTFVRINITSTILHSTTKQSKKLNKETKYPWKPRLYIFTNISRVNRITKNMLAISEKEKKNTTFMYLPYWNNKYDEWKGWFNLFSNKPCL